MLGKDLSEALGGISDEKLQDAMTVYKRKKQVRSLWFRAAALAATLAIVLTAALWPRETEEGGIITAPGILKAYAYEMKGNEKIDLTVMEGSELMDGSIPSYKAVFCPYLSVAEGIVITPVITEKSLMDTEITFEVTANYGELYGDFYSEKYTGGNMIQATRENAFLGKQTIIENGETIYWEGYEILSAADDTMACKEKVYVDLIIKADEHIVGYAVFEMVPWLDGENIIGFEGQLKHTVFYPLVDGEFQNITADYVEQQIAECKAN